MPSGMPTAAPSAEPSASPTASPTDRPSLRPSTSPAPTVSSAPTSQTVVVGQVRGAVNGEFAQPRESTTLSGSNMLIIFFVGLSLGGLVFWAGISGDLGVEGAGDMAVLRLVVAAVDPDGR